MTRGIAVNKNTRKPVVGTNENTPYSIEELCEKCGINLDDVDIYSYDDLDSLPEEGFQQYHTIDKDKKVKDNRIVIGYNVQLEKKEMVGNEEVVIENKKVKVENEDTIEELSKKLNMDIRDIKTIKK